MGPVFHAALAFLVLSGTSSASSRSITQLPKLPELPKPFKTWYLHPVYTLGSRGSVPVNTSLWPLEHTFLQEEWPAVRLDGLLPGERYQDFFDPSGMSGNAVSIEMLLIDHVNQPVDRKSTRLNSSH